MALSIGRFAIRNFVTRQLHWDDLFHLLALLVLIAKTVTTQVSDGLNKRLGPILGGVVPMPPEAQFFAMYRKVRYFDIFSNIEMWLCYWLVKLTFMMFYRLLFDVSKRFRMVWWITLTFVIVTFWPPVAGIMTICGGSARHFSSWGMPLSLQFESGHCIEG